MLGFFVLAARTCHDDEKIDTNRPDKYGEYVRSECTPITTGGAPACLSRRAYPCHDTERRESLLTGSNSAYRKWA